MTDFINQPWFWLYYISYSLLIVATLLHMLYKQRSPQSLMTWMLALILLPYLGVLLYLFFGSRKFFKARRKPAISITSLKQCQPQNKLARQTDRILSANHINTTTQDNDVKLFHDCQAAFNSFLAEIKQATQSIYIETYIFEIDETGEQILQALEQKASQGVEVCLLIDGIGSYELYRNQHLLKGLQKQGGKVAFFHPLFSTLFRGQLNLRNHRKIYLFDQTVLFTGGINLSSDYLGASDDQRWKDLIFKVQGPAVQHYSNLFNEDWLYTTGQPLIHDHPPLLELTANQRPSSEDPQQILQVIPSGPDIEGDALLEAMLHSIYAAQHQIQIVTPYFIPDSAILNALLIAIKRGIKVQLFTPEVSDHLIFDLGRSSYTRELAEAGAEVFYYTDNMLHAKLVMVDDSVMLSGSANLDYRSLFINYEVVNMIYAQPQIRQAQQWIDDLKPDCIHYHPTTSAVRRLFENLTRIFAPIL